MGWNIITTRHIRWLIFDIPLLLLMLTIIVFIPPFVPRAAYGRNDGYANVVRENQLLLSLKGYYTGPINSKCNEQTLHAIEKYKATLANTPPGANCRIDLLETLKERLIASLSTAKSTTPDIPSRSSAEERGTIDTTALSNIKSDITNTINAVKILNEGVSDHFVTLSSNMNNMWVTTLLTGFGILATIMV